jgi:biopolymer transport protein TolR
MARIKSRRKVKMMADMNVVPYIDVMLVLLIIFMVTAPLITQGVKVELPQATAEPVDSEAEPVIVSVDRDGNFYIDVGDDREEPEDAASLQAKVMAQLVHKPGAQVLINGDANVSYQRVVEVMALLQQAGVKNVGLMTQPAS